MSTINLINNNNLPTNEALATYFAKASMEMLKKVRFDFGCGISHKKMREMLRLERYVCNSICYINGEDVQMIREEVIKEVILKINGLPR